MMQISFLFVRLQIILELLDQLFKYLHHLPFPLIILKLEFNYSVLFPYLFFDSKIILGTL